MPTTVITVQRGQQYDEILRRSRLQLSIALEGVSGSLLWSFLENTRSLRSTGFLFQGRSFWREWDGGVALCTHCNMILYYNEK